MLVQDLIVLPKYRQKGIENSTFSICLGTIQRCTKVPRRHYYNRRRSQLFLSTLRNEKIGRRANGILLQIRIFLSGIIRKQIPQRKTNEDRLFSFKSILIHRKGFDECIRYGIFAAIFSSFQFTSGFPKRRLSIMLLLSAISAQFVYRLLNFEALEHLHRADVQFLSPVPNRVLLHPNHDFLIYPP